MGDITALGDRCHWRLKAPASGLERMEVERGEKTERETVAAERVNTNAAGKSRQATSGEVEGKEGALQVEERQMARAVFSLQYDCLCTKTVITQGTRLLTGVETLCFVFVSTFSFFFDATFLQQTFSFYLPDRVLQLPGCSPLCWWHLFPKPVSELWGQVLPPLPQGQFTCVSLVLPRLPVVPLHHCCATL